MEQYELEELGESILPIDFEPIKIEQNNINYILNIKAIENNITLFLNDTAQFPSIDYIREMSLKEIKDLNKVFFKLNSPNDFYYYLKSLSDNNKLFIKNQDDIFSLILIIGTKQEIKIDLYPTKKDIDLNIKEIYQELSNIKKEISALKKENKEIKKENKEIKKENIILKNDIKEMYNKINQLEGHNQKPIKDFIYVKKKKIKQLRKI